MMATINLAGRSTFSNGWVKWLAIAIVAGVLGLGAKAVWFDQQRYLVPVSVVPEGAKLQTVQWRAVPASLGALGGQYVTAAKAPRGFALSTLFPNKLVQVSQLGAFAPDSLARVVVTNKTQLGSGVHAGAAVAIWSAQRLQANQYDAPKRLVAHAQVSRVIKNSAMFGAQSQQVEVLIQPIQTPAVLQAMASDSAIFLVAQQ